MDLCPYDDSLTSAVLQARMEASVALPQATGVSTVWVADTAADKSRMVKYVSRREVMDKK